MARRRRPEGEPRLYMHDVRIAGGVVSVACTGPSCDICAKDPKAAQRANNTYFMMSPWQKGTHIDTMPVEENEPTPPGVPTEEK